MESLIRVRDELDPSAILDLTVFDPSPHPWCGPNFAPDMPEALTNVYTSDMSVRYWDMEHITNWLKANGYTHFAGSKFAPRSIIGQYLQDSAKQAMDHVEAFEFVREKAVKVTLNDHVVIETPTQSYNFDYAVLCTGGATRYDPYGLQGEENFFVTPYPLKDHLGSVSADEHIGIIGSGLTAIDLVFGLRASNHRGPITIMSRRGLLPAVRRPSLEYRLRYFSVKGIEDIAAAKGRVTLEDLIDLTYKELDHAGASKRPLIDEILTNRYGIDRLRHQLAHLYDGEFAYQLALKMMAAAYDDGWFLLGHDEKNHLFRHFRHIAYSLCCPMPEYRAAQILELADSGQLNVIRGLQSVSKDPGGKFTAIAEGIPPLQLDKVFSAASSGENRISAMAIPVIEGLLQTGQARRHPFGGLDVERTTGRLTDARNRPQPQLYALGCTVGGALYVLSALVWLARRSVHLAHAIVSDGSKSANLAVLQRLTNQPTTIVN